MGVVLFVFLFPVIIIYVVSLLQYVIGDVTQDYLVGFPPSEYFAPETWFKISGSASLIGLFYSIGVIRIKTTRGSVRLLLLSVFLIFILSLYTFYKLVIFVYNGTRPTKEYLLVSHHSPYSFY